MKLISNGRVSTIHRYSGAILKDLHSVLFVESCDSAGTNFIIGKDEGDVVLLTADELHQLGQELITMSGKKE